MTYEMYRYVFLGGAIASGIMFAVSIVLFFTLKIPKVISDLTGRTARRAIEDIRLQNERSGDKTYKSSAVNLQRGKLTDKISPSGRLMRREASPFGTGVITEKISTQRLAPGEGPDETTVLAPANETTVLDAGYGETTVLQVDAAASAAPMVQGFEIEYEITYIHTNEVIA